MNTQQEIRQAIEDFQMGKNGFEKARTWKSVEGNKWNTATIYIYNTNILKVYVLLHITPQIVSTINQDYKQNLLQLLF